MEGSKHVNQEKSAQMLLQERKSSIYAKPRVGSMTKKNYTAPEENQGHGGCASRGCTSRICVCSYNKVTLLALGWGHHPVHSPSLSFYMLLMQLGRSPTTSCARAIAEVNYCLRDANSFSCFPWTKTSKI